MSMSAAQQGKTYTVESLLPAVERLLLDIESVLPRDIVESFSPMDWAILISHARQHNLQPRDLLMEIIHSGMANSARHAMNMHRKKTAQATRESDSKRPRPVLKLVK
jgi:hypothetical protein